MTQPAKDGDRVRVHYTGRLADGQVFDSSVGGEPLEFVVGSGEVISGFDTAVRGLSVGEARTVEIEPEDAYGQHNDKLIAKVSPTSSLFSGKPAIGTRLNVPLRDGTQFPVVVTEVTDTHVTIDGNHPLAGQKLIFDVELVEREQQRP